MLPAVADDVGAASESGDWLMRMRMSAVGEDAGVSVRGVLNAPVLCRCRRSNVSCSSLGRRGGAGPPSKADEARAVVVPKARCACPRRKSWREELQIARCILANRKCADIACVVIRCVLAQSVLVLASNEHLGRLFEMLRTAAHGTNRSATGSAHREIQITHPPRQAIISNTRRQKQIRCFVSLSTPRPKAACSAPKPSR